MFCSYYRPRFMIIVIASFMTGCVTTDQYGNIRPDQAQMVNALAGMAAAGAGPSNQATQQRQPTSQRNGATQQRSASHPRSGNDQQPSAADNNPMNALMAAAVGQAIEQSTHKKSSKSKPQRIVLPNGQQQVGGNQQQHVANNGQKPNRPMPPQSGQPPRRIRPTE